MKASRSPGRWIIILLGAGLLLALAPATALAQTLNVVAYEVGEALTCHPGGTANPVTDPLCALANTTEGLGTRMASATLVGGLSSLPGGVSVSGTPVAGVTVDATSVVNLGDLAGPIFGKATLYQGGTIATGTLSGQLDLSQLASGLAPVSGHWRILNGTLKGGGTFFGAALIPFPCASATGLCYLALDPSTGQPSGGVVPVASTEIVSGFPLVKWVLTLVTQ